MYCLITGAVLITVVDTGSILAYYSGGKSIGDINLNDNTRSNVNIMYRCVGKLSKMLNIIRVLVWV